MIGTAWAQVGGAGGGPSPLVSFMPLILVFVVFYFLLIRPQQQKAKEHRSMLENLKKNDEVVTSGAFKLRNGAAVLVDNSIQPANSAAPKPEDS